MKFIHISDLHIGLHLHELSMLEEQRAILWQILAIVDREAPDGVLIAGDVYDKAVPSAEAVGLFDSFLSELAQRGTKTFVISGNHDSPERIAFGSRIMQAGGIHLSPVYNGAVEPIPMTDAHGRVNVYLLPFLKPMHVRRFFPDAEIGSYTDAVRVAIAAMQVDTGERNLLVSHQFITGTGSGECVTVGGTDNVDAAVFADFDYVALGHIHAATPDLQSRIRYCGTPLRYSFSEMRDEKSVTVAELGAKGDLTLRTVPLVPLHGMQELRGEFDRLIQREFYEGTTLPTDYLRVILTDENEVPNAMGRLRSIYTNLLYLDYDNTRTRALAQIAAPDALQQLSPLEAFAQFYEKQNGAPMSAEQQEFMAQLIEQLEEVDA